MILPVAWIALAAFKTQIALLRGDVAFTPYFGNFDELLFAKTADYFGHFANSLVVASATTLIVLAVATPAAYSMVRMRLAALGAGGAARLFARLPHDSADHAGRALVRDVPLARLDNTYGALVLTHVALNLPIGALRS